MELSKRLYAVASMVTKGNRVADVGTDHAYIPIYLVRQKITPGAIAMDINKGPMERAKKHIEAYGLSNYIEVRLSDGVHELKKDEADTLIVAGMGGALVKKIMEEGKEVLSSMQELILQPQSEVFLVRKYLEEAGFRITEENFVLDDGKYYPMMKAVKGNMFLKEDIFYQYGAQLLKKQNMVLKEFLLKEQQLYLSIEEKLCGNQKEDASQRKKEVQKKLSDIEKALEFYK